MNNESSFCIRFCGLTIRFVSPTAVNLPENFTALMCENVENPTAEYKVCLLKTPLCPQTQPVSKEGGVDVYSTDDGFLRIYTSLTEDDGCQVACLMRKNGKNILYYPEKKWHHYRKYWHCTHLLAGELLLMWNDAFLLHSSVVMINGKVVLFSGPSGAGKSTQAGLWAEHKNAQIINGDRCVLSQKDGVFYGGGSPWSGTSGIFSNEQAPIAGIFILQKSATNEVRRLKAEAFSHLYSQTTINSWDKLFVEKMSSFYSQLLSAVDVFELKCLPDESAVTLAYNTLFDNQAEI